MPIENHNLALELPEFKDDIHSLKMTDDHFKKLSDEYHYLTNEIKKMEQEILLVSTEEEETFKKRRLQLKDTLVDYLKQSQTANQTSQVQL
ncbi:YdcH family protein [Marinomonas spartinae]|uniref:YdcH family protein n=1 Tax=Marinomonas spartinae TaxID=1792290 RepID=UPI0018F18213|nr:DUF465 domain-containing protein [Marinomonas spartinae]MBJ7553569.1 DUF465 domain-containing protein [Marinomonas spartinae]